MTANIPQDCHQFDVVAVNVKCKSDAMYLYLPLLIILSDFSPCYTVDQQVGEEPNITLICAGLLGCSPTNPSFAFSLDCLELYHQIHCRQASFSVQAMVKVLCTLHNVRNCMEMSS